MLIPRKPRYTLVEPTNDIPDENWWIQIDQGKFRDTVIAFGTLQPTEECLKYNFTIKETTYPDLTEKNKELRKTVENILVDILKQGLYGEQDFNTRNSTPDTK